MTIEQTAATLLAAIRVRRPMIHHLANFVTINDVAAATRAVGALPVMAMAREEAEEIVAHADALVVNLGTPTQERLEVIELAVRAARGRGLPIVIDPVGAGSTRFRTEAVKKLTKEASRAIVRANAAEAAVMAGLQAEIRGVESVGEYDLATVATALARSGMIAAVTGPRDIVTDGEHCLAVDNGHPWLAAMPGAGCMATAVVGTFCAVADPDELVTAVAAALACFGLAAERAALQAGGPGTMKPLLFDALFALTPQDVQTGIRCTELTSL